MIDIARNNAKKTRFDGLSQNAQRRLTRIKLNIKKKDGETWADKLLKTLKKDVSDENT